MTSQKFPVLVTGGAGYIGSHATLALREAGWPVVVLDNLSTGFRWAIPDDVALVEGNIGDAAIVDCVLAEHKIGAILHFAGSILVPESVADPLKYYDNNTASSRILIERAVAAGVKHFIFSSTATIYGDVEQMPLSEDLPPSPINPYGTSKWMTEMMLRDVSAAHPINHAVLRYFNVAGADPEGRTGQSTAGATHLIKVACEAALGKRDSVAIFGDDYATKDGTGVRDYIHVSDLADAHVAALDWLVANSPDNLLANVGYAHGATVNEVLDAVDRVTNMKIERRLQGRRAGDPAALVADNSRALNVLGWTPKRDDLDGIVRDALAWERKLADRR
ncbi:UDP-glucose 4-epimerase [Sphingomonas antarctica]|uniref:UDP-glucose 4-epimerase GalE n=1 Tax=Sphingomonas antarctica TaxID=2040274 RepID=UPI0039EBE3D9